MPLTCMVEKCRSRGGRDKFSFYRIPLASGRKYKPDKNELCRLRRKVWLSLINGSDLKECQLKNARVCSRHFISGKPAHLKDVNNPDWAPSLYMNNNSQPLKTLDDNKTQKQTNSEIGKQTEKEEIHSEEVVAEPSTLLQSFVIYKETETKECQTDIKMADLNGIKTDSDFINDHFISPILPNDNLSLESFTNNDNKVKYYTGLENFEVFESLFRSIKPFLTNHHNNSLSMFHQVLLTFMKLQLDLDFRDLAYRFDVCPTTAYNNFLNVLDILHLHFAPIVLKDKMDDSETETDDV